jgi:hypothetical protein
MLLAARASGELSDADRERLQRHLSRCSACRVIEARFQQAERAYRNARPEALPPAVAASIVEALSAAAPVSDEVAPDAPETPASMAEHVAAAHGAEPEPTHDTEPVVEPELAAQELVVHEFAADAEHDESEVGYGNQPVTAVFGADVGAPMRQEPGTIAFAAGAARRARGALLRPGALRRRTTRPDPALRHHRRGGFAARIGAPAAIVLGALVAALAVAGVFHSKSHSARRVAITSTTPPAAAPAPAPAAKKPHKHRHRRHRKRSHATVVAATRPPVATTTKPQTATAPPQQVATVAPAPRPTATHPSAPPSTAHVIGGPTSQAPPQTGAPAGTGPSGYQPSTP